MTKGNLVIEDLWHREEFDLDLELFKEDCVNGVRGIIGNSVGSKRFGEYKDKEELEKLTTR
nr:2918_t:CDS:2 [Entrophospora candida]